MNISKLPIEVLEIIFKNLSIKQLNECRKVNKMFNFTIEHMNFDCLVIYELDLPFNEKQRFTYEQIDCRYSINDFYSFDKEIQKEIYKKFKKIYFHSQDSIDYQFFEKITFIYNYVDSHYLQTRPADLSSLNYLDQLKELSLNGVGIIGIIKLKLPNLELLKLNEIKKSHSNIENKLILDTPKLIKLSCLCLKRIQFINNPITIKYLEIYKYYTILPEVFLNLEYLYLFFLKKNRFDIDSDAKIFDFKNFKNLKELHVYYYNFEYRSDYIFSLNLLKKFKNENNRIEVYFLGLSIDLDNDLEIENKFSNEEQIEFYLNNYKYLSNQIQSINTIILNSIYSNLDKMTECFCRRLVNLNEISINTKLKDNDKLDKFEIFLKRLKNISQFIFYHSPDEQFFLTILPRTMPLIENLIFIIDEGNSFSKLDFNFLLKFKYLKKIEFQNYRNNLININLIRKLFDLIYLKKFCLNGTIDNNFFIFRINKYFDGINLSYYLHTRLEEGPDEFSEFVNVMKLIDYLETKYLLLKI